MEIDISQIRYDVDMITETGARYSLNDALLSLRWEEQSRELAQRAVITVTNFAVGSTWLMAMAKINCIILVYAQCNGEKTLVFEGTIWEWKYTSSSQRTLNITAYDKLIRLQQSQDFKYYTAGQTTPNLIGDICGTWGIPFEYLWEQSITHEKKVFNGNNVSDMIITLLDEVKQKTGSKYVIYYKDNKIQIIGYGTNQVVYKFTNEVTVSTEDSLSINNLVTRVKILGTADDDGRSAVEALVDGDTRYGILQKILRRDSDKTLDAATAEANTILNENGKPEENISVVTPDLPFLRKGDAVEMEAGNLLGIFYVEGVSHCADDKTMTLTLTRSKGEGVVNTLANYQTDTSSKREYKYLGTMPISSKSDRILVNDRIK